jgi:hypothetical protein
MQCVTASGLVFMHSRRVATALQEHMFNYVWTQQAMVHRETAGPTGPTNRPGLTGRAESPAYTKPQQPIRQSASRFGAIRTALRAAPPVRNRARLHARLRPVLIQATRSAQASRLAPGSGVTPEPAAAHLRLAPGAPMPARDERAVVNCPVCIITGRKPLAPCSGSSAGRAAAAAGRFKHCAPHRRRHHQL